MLSLEQTRKHVNGKCRPELDPKFCFIKNSGDRTKRPMIAIVPAQAPLRAILSPKGLPAVEKPN